MPRPASSTFGWPRDRLLLFIAGGEEAMVRAKEGAEDEPGQAIDLVRRHGIASNDVLIAVAASGTTPFTLACLREAKRCSALTLGIANNPGTPLLQEAEHAIFLETGPEPIAGSTRMNAGTAQRIALSLLSSLVMIRLGKVYAGLMVDVQASNAKLTERRENMLIHLTGSSGEDVRKALKRARGSVKLALLLLKGCDLKEAERVLDCAGGQLRGALALVAQDQSNARRRTSGEPPRAKHAR